MSRKPGVCHVKLPPGSTMMPVYNPCPGVHLVQHCRVLVPGLPLHSPYHTCRPSGLACFKKGWGLVILCISEIVPLKLGSKDFPCHFLGWPWLQNWQGLGIFVLQPRDGCTLEVSHGFVSLLTQLLKSKKKNPLKDSFSYPTIHRVGPVG